MMYTTPEQVNVNTVYRIIGNSASGNMAGISKCYAGSTTIISVHTG